MSEFQKRAKNLEIGDDIWEDGDITEIDHIASGEVKFTAPEGDEVVRIIVDLGVDADEDDPELTEILKRPDEFVRLRHRDEE